MCRPLALMLAAALLHTAASAQAPSPRVVDVAVEDPSGHPLHGLQPSDFRLTDSNATQNLLRIEEHSSQSAANFAPTLAPLPPGTFTNYTPLAPGATLNILLLDALNTSAKNQHFIRTQLQQYVEHANPNTRIAIFGLANRLILLQGFTSDPATLRDVIERKLIARSPTAPETSSHFTQPSAIEIAANLRQFESETGAMETLLRPQYTLDAFNTLAHYLAAFPGRKNLLWFSGAFPLNLLPNPHPTVSAPTEAEATDQAELHETLDLFARAQVAIDPIDARGLIIPPPPAAADHAAAAALASATGGRAFHPTTTLADAVATAIDVGANYYTLTYIPTKGDDAYHPLHIELAGPNAVPHPHLLYRPGYDTTPSAPTANDGRTSAYKQAAMSRGAPLPEDLIFKVRAQPDSTATETSVAPNNQLSAFVPSNGPFRRYDLDFLTLAAQLTLTPQAGHTTANVEFVAYVYDTDGRVLNATGTNLSLQAATTDIAKLARNVVRGHLEISIPDRVETFLRVGVRDVSTNRFGVVEVPASTLSYLPPAPHPAATAPPSSARPATPPQD